jgi:hypothetical protein
MLSLAINLIIFFSLSKTSIKLNLLRLSVLGNNSGAGAQSKEEVVKLIDERMEVQKVALQAVQAKVDKIDDTVRSSFDALFTMLRAKGNDS